MVKKGAKKTGKAAKAAKAAKTLKAAEKAVVDVRDKTSVNKLLDVIKGNKVTLVLIYADWCGHCKTFKEEVWKKLKDLPNRKLPLAEVNADVLSETPLAAAKITGYPSVVPIGSDLVMPSLRDDSGNETNALPNTRNTELMSSLVMSDPEEVLSANEAEPRSEMLSAVATAATEAAVDNNGNNEDENNNNNDAEPPNVEDDIMQAKKGGTAPPLLPQRKEGGALFSFLSGAASRKQSGGRRRPRRSTRRTKRQA